MHYVYHQDHEPIIVSSEDYDSYLSNGWVDSPAKLHEKKVVDVTTDLNTQLTQKEKELEKLLDVDSSKDKEKSDAKKPQKGKL